MRRQIVAVAVVPTHDFSGRCVPPEDASRLHNRFNRPVSMAFLLVFILWPVSVFAQSTQCQSYVGFNGGSYGASGPTSASIQHSIYWGEAGDYSAESAASVSCAIGDGSECGTAHSSIHFIDQDGASDFSTSSTIYQDALLIWSGAPSEVQIQATLTASYTASSYGEAEADLHLSGDLGYQTLQVEGTQAASGQWAIPVVSDPGIGELPLEITFSAQQSAFGKGEFSTTYDVGFEINVNAPAHR